MAELRWTRQAADDLENIVEYIAQDSARSARKFAASVLEAIQRLAGHPESGRIVPECNDPKLREIIHGNYRIIYRVANQGVDILTIYHAARQLDGSTLK